MPLVFAFGSNLDTTQMARRCPSARAVGVGVLRGYELAFGGWSVRWGGAVATVLPAGARTRTVGGIYQITPKDLEALDGFEGAPHVYERTRERVWLRDGSSIDADFYALRRFAWEMPSLDYARAIARGYGAWGLDRQALLRVVRKSQRMTDLA